VQTDDLASSIQVRFFIRGTSGSLRLRFPKIAYKAQLETTEDQALVFYRLANATVNAILDDDYYTHQPHTLNDLSVDLGMFPEMVDLAPFRKVLVREDARRQFLLTMDLGQQWSKWDPHLRVLDDLVASEVILADVKSLLDDLVRRTPSMAVRLLSVCQDDAQKYRIGGLVARALAGQLQTIPAELRAQAEEAVLSWAVDREQESWDVEADTGEFGSLGLKWRIDDIAFDVLPVIVWKLLGVIHARLTVSTADNVDPLLRKYDWCVTVAKSLPAHHSKIPAALRLIAEGRVPKSVSEADRVLKSSVSSAHALDEAVLNQFGLPLWPLLTAVRRDGKVEIANKGIGAALDARVQTEIGEPDGDGEATTFNLGPGDSVLLPLPSEHAAANVQFEKLGRTYRVAVAIVGAESSIVVMDNHQVLPVTINHKRLSAQREYRKAIDPEGIVVGSSPALLEIFEHIHHANQTEGLPAVLLLGEPGVGKTHIAALLHKSSARAKKPFEVVNAGSGGGDINIQRGEWIGYGKNHGLQYIDKNGQPGHLMKANGGTLFVDEFASLSHDLQVNFLSVLEKKSVQKVGGESFSPDVRCIFATNADIDKLIEDGSLRRDLLDRIPVRFRIPPLRERRGDILLLARHFAGDHKIAPRCLIALLRYDWPGNVRDLQSKVAAAIAHMKSAGKSILDLSHFELPEDVVSVADGLEEEACRRELWTLADEIARTEGFEQGMGLQKRAAEILGVSEAQASKMYREFCLTKTSAASA
jgi:DNA-binding NtrC family response regulator